MADQEYFSKVREFVQEEFEKADRTGETFRKEDVREKFDWMYERISSEKAREIAEPWYRDAIEKLEKK